VGAFTGQIPDASDPATFDARANAIWDWLVTSLVSDFNLSAGQVNAALADIQDVLAGSDTLVSRFNELGNLSGLDRYDLGQQIATWKEGSDGSTRLISPNQLRQVILHFAAQDAAGARFDGDWTEFSHNQTVTLNHGLGDVPRDVSIEYQAKYAEYGFAVGEVIQGAFMVEGDGSNEGVGVIKSATQLTVMFAGNGAGVAVRRDGESFLIKQGRWKFRVTARI
jgi:hypothetical protein